MGADGNMMAIRQLSQSGVRVQVALCHTTYGLDERYDVCSDLLFERYSSDAFLQFCIGESVWNSYNLTNTTTTIERSYS